MFHDRARDHRPEEKEAFDELPEEGGTGEDLGQGIGSHANWASSLKPTRNPEMPMVEPQLPVYWIVLVMFPLIT